MWKICGNPVYSLCLLVWSAVLMSSGVQVFMRYTKKTSCIHSTHSTHVLQKSCHVSFHLCDFFLQSKQEWDEIHHVHGLKWIHNGSANFFFTSWHGFPMYNQIIFRFKKKRKVSWITNTNLTERRTWTNVWMAYINTNHLNLWYKRYMQIFCPTHQ